MKLILNGIMKKRICLFVIFVLYTLVLCSCQSQSESELDIFIRRFDEQHPKGYQLQDGWYKYMDYNVRYRTDLSNIVDTFSNSFVGNVRFSIEENEQDFLYCIAECFTEIQTTTSLLSIHSTKESIEDIYRTSYDGTKSYIEHKQYRTCDSNSVDVIDFPFQENDIIGGVKISFSLRKDFLDFSKLRKNLSSNPFCKIEVSVMEKMLRCIYEYSYNSYVEEIINEYSFDEYFEVIKIKSFSHSSSTLQSPEDYFSDRVIMLEKVKSIDISFPNYY